MKSVALLLLRGGFFLPARVMARTKAKEAAKRASKSAKAAKSKGPSGPPWADAMSTTLERDVSLWNVDGKGACAL